MDKTAPKHTNRLAQEKSPYLLQHAHNPVDWYAWGPEAFEKAKKENKPIFLSIGYATCHWCHVMERESFENEAIAQVMNELFVNIKVDREERPDVDHIYMTAVQAMVGGGGWPLSVFLSPSLEPFFGGTYFPPDNRHGRPGFPTILKEISRMWKEENSKVVEWGEKIRKSLQDQTPMKGAGKLTEENFKQVYAHFEESFDAVDGGFGGAPKFPRSESLSLLLRIYHRTGDKHALDMVTHTLSKMARGGIYDHAGGAFARYSTDRQWLVPHFEKMLYDNALLVKTYLETFQIDRNPMWAHVARETLDYVLRDMTSPEGGYYSAEDADSEGVEGKYYVWSEEELEKLLTSEEFSKIKSTYHVSKHGNFEGHNILRLDDQTNWDVKYSPPLSTALQKMWAYREKRIHPLKDDKVLASWNGLMISAMCLGSKVLGEEKYLTSAQKAGSFLKTFWKNNTLHRRYRAGEMRFDASLEDYAFLIQAYLDLYETDFSFEWLSFAQTLQKRCDELFWDALEGAYFSTDGQDKTLIARTKDIYDGAIPSGNSISTLNLLRLHALTENHSFHEKAEKIFSVFSGNILRAPYGSPSLLIALDFNLSPSVEIVLSGDKKSPEAKKILQEMSQKFLPHKVMAFVEKKEDESQLPLFQNRAPQSEKTLVYVCQNQSCQQPVSTWEELEPLLIRP